MCTYNGAQHLPEQLESIARQTQPPSELIVCDDGSKDGTIALITEFSRKVTFRVRLFCNGRNLGPAKNFEQAIGLCEGEIIFLCDQDDVWEPCKIRNMLEVFTSHPDGYYAFSDAQTIDQSGKLLNQTLWAALNLRAADFIGSKQLERLLKSNVITGAGLAFRSSLREIVLPIPPGWMHDECIGLLGSVISDGILVSEPLYKYRRHSAQVIGFRKSGLFQALLDSLASNNETSRRKLLAFRSLLERLNGTCKSGTISAERMNLLKQKEFHLLQRAIARSERGVNRFSKVFAEARSGRYGRFSNSSWSILRDLTSFKLLERD